MLGEIIGLGLVGLSLRGVTSDEEFVKEFYRRARGFHNLGYPLAEQLWEGGQKQEGPLPGIDCDEARRRFRLSADGLTRTRALSNDPRIPRLVRGCRPETIQREVHLVPGSRSRPGTRRLQPDLCSMLFQAKQLADWGTRDLYDAEKEIRRRCGWSPRMPAP
jgi:hypothetical protein